MNTDTCVLAYKPPIGAPAFGEIPLLAGALFRETLGGGAVPSWVLIPARVAKDLGNEPRDQWIQWNALGSFQDPTRDSWPRALVLLDPLDPDAGNMGRLRVNDVMLRSHDYVKHYAWVGNTSDMEGFIPEWAGYLVNLFGGALLYIDPTTGREVLPALREGP